MPVQRYPYYQDQVFFGMYTGNPAEVMKILLVWTPFIIAHNEDTCFEGGDSACPPGPPLRTVMVLLLPSPGVIPVRGATWRGETP